MATSGKMTDAEIVMRGRNRLAALRAENQLLEIQVILMFGATMGGEGPFILVRFMGLIPDDEWEFGMRLNRTALAKFSQDEEERRIEAKKASQFDA